MMTKNGLTRVKPIFFIVISLLAVPAIATYISLHPKVLRTPDSAFDLLSSVGYPWSPKYTTYDYGLYKELRLHYIDEGEFTKYKTEIISFTSTEFYLPSV